MRGVVPQGCPQAVHRVRACRPPDVPVLPRRAVDDALPTRPRARLGCSEPASRVDARSPLATPGGTGSAALSRSALPSTTFPCRPIRHTINLLRSPCEPDRVRRLAGARGHAGAQLRRRPDPAAGHGGGAVGARRDDDHQGRHRRRRRDAPRRRLLPALPRDDPRRDHRPLRPRRAGRHGHRRRRAAARGRAAAGRRGALPAHAHLVGADRRQRLLLRRDRPREGGPAPAGRRRHPHRAVRLRRRGRRRRPRRPGPGRGLRGHREAQQRGLRAALGDHGRRPRRDRGDRQP